MWRGNKNKQGKRVEEYYTNTEVLEKQIGFFQNVYVISKQRNEKNHIEKNVTYFLKYRYESMTTLEM